MATIRLRVEVSGLTEAERLVQKIERQLQHDREDGLQRAVQEVAKVFEENYNSEGSLSGEGGWKALSEYSNRIREWQGFPAEHPILVRYGALRGVVIHDIKDGRPGNFRRGDNYGGPVTTGRLEINNDLAHMEVEGFKALNQIGHKNWKGSDIPPRPFWFANKRSAVAAREGFTMWLVDEVLKP